jgi:hypothetical protein
MQTLTSSVQNEFWFHVSNQDEIPIFGVVDKSLDIPLLLKVIQDLPTMVSEQHKFILKIIQNNPETIDILRTLVGISDKRMYLELSYIFSKTKLNATDTNNLLGKTFYELDRHPLPFFKGLISAKNAAVSVKTVEIIGNYLVEKQLIDILLVFKKLTQRELETVIEKLILPKEIQQAEAKRRGHGAEHGLAALLFDLGVSFIPKDRHENPMGSQDPNVDIETFEITQKTKGKTWSFDLVIENRLQKPLVFLQGLIHTSDPGQYGVNKSDETVQIKRDLEKHNKANQVRKEHWGLVDGVGFSENKKDTIDKMLGEFDCFLQMKSLFKAALRLHKLDLVKLKAIRFDPDFYTKEEARLMFEKYGNPDIVLLEGETELVGKEIKAGKAWLHL